MANPDPLPSGMTPQSPAAIAAQLDRDRAALAQSIAGLRDRLAPDAVMDDALLYVRTNVAQYAQTLEGVVRANPLAAVLVGAGVAWLALVRRAQPEPEPEFEPEPAATETDSDWIIEADQLRNLAVRELDRIASSKVHPADAAVQRAGVLTSLANATRAIMLRGLEGLSHEAQDRLLAARESAYAARMELARRAGRMIEDHPLVAAGIGMAIGAAVGAALPGTATEDRLLGADRDRLLAQAKGLLRQEQDKATRAGVALAASFASEIVLGAARTEKV